MNAPTIRVVFDRKKQATKQKAAIVQVEVLYGGKRKYFSTGVKVFKDQWKEKTMVTGRMDAIGLNEKINLLVNKVQSFINDLMKKNETFSFDKLGNYMSVSNSNGSFIDFVYQRINERNMKNSTRIQHLAMYRRLIEFGKIQSFEDLTVKNIKLFDDFERKFSSNQSTIHCMHKRLKVYVREALLFELIDKNPYDTFVVQRGSCGKRKYLNEEELSVIRSIEIRDRSIDNVRDCFVFCCFTGLAYSDLKSFDWENNVVMENGKFVIKDTRQKTDTPYNITILSPAMEILKKHNYKLPVISNQQYNMRLKVLGSYAQISKPLTSHVARHTFATWALSKGVRIEVVSKMLAHTDIKTTQIYAKIIQKEVAEGFDILEGKIIGE